MPVEWFGGNIFLNILHAHIFLNKIWLKLKDMLSFICAWHIYQKFNGDHLFSNLTIDNLSSVCKPIGSSLWTREVLPCYADDNDLPVACSRLAWKFCEVSPDFRIWNFTGMHKDYHGHRYWSCETWDIINHSHIRTGYNYPRTLTL